ncbi:hypothetical protein EV363DRAFT_1552187, partial [Boletus edulis]
DVGKHPAYHLRRRAAPTFFRFGRKDITEGNVGADRLASEGANKQPNDVIDTNIPATSFNLQGAKIVSITQAGTLKTQTTTSITRRQRILRNCRFVPYDCDQYESRRNHMAQNETPGSLRIGKFWSKIKNYEHRAKCSRCNYPEEPLEHISTDCPSTKASTV